MNPRPRLCCHAADDGYAMHWLADGETCDKSPKRGPGRPPIGQRVHVNVPGPLLAEIEAAAKRAGTTRAAEIRRRLAADVAGGLAG